LGTVALNQVIKSCELIEASHRGGVRFWAGALARTASNPPSRLTPKQRLKQSYTRLSGLTQAGFSSVRDISAVSKSLRIHFEVSFLTDRSLHESAANGLFAFLVSMAKPS
jgi:hypothetical protein